MCLKTLPETSIARARKPSQKEINLPTSNHPFSGAMLVSRRYFLTGSKGIWSTRDI